MMYSFVTCDVFTTTRFAGNPLAVVLAADGLSDTQMQQIAREFNYSETSFVLRPKNPQHTARLRIFTPTLELPFAGHPTIGAAFVLASNGSLAPGLTRLVFEQKMGAVAVDLTPDAAGAVQRCMLHALAAPQSRVQLLAPSVAAEVLSLPLAAIAALPLAPWSCGVPFLVLPLASRAALERCQLNLASWTTHIKGRWAQNVYPVYIDAARKTVDVRMFAPSLGVSEDPATGSAAAGLAGYLAAHIDTDDGDYHWTILQGGQIGRPSVIFLSFRSRNGVASQVQIGGSSVAVTQGQIAI